MPRKENQEICSSAFISLLEEVKLDYQDATDLNHPWTNKPTVRLKSGPMIRVWAESIKRWKLEKSGDRKRNLPATVSEDKEYFDPEIIPSKKNS